MKDMHFLFIIIFVIAALCVLASIVFIVYGILKKKWKLAVITSAVSLLIPTGSILYIVLFPTQFPYIDSWVYGKSKEAIIEKYGEPEYNWDRMIGYYTGEDHGFFGIMDSNNSFYYYIYFDENGMADTIQEGIQKGG